MSMFSVVCVHVCLCLKTHIQERSLGHMVLWWYSSWQPKWLSVFLSLCFFCVEQTVVPARFTKANSELLLIPKVICCLCKQEAGHKLAWLGYVRFFLGWIFWCFSNRFWCLLPSLFSAWFLARWCTRPYLSPTPCEGLAAAFCLCLQIGPDLTISTKSTQVHVWPTNESHNLHVKTTDPLDLTNNS